MSHGNGNPAQDLTLRAAGFVLAASGILALRLLHHSVQLPPRHEASIAELAFAAIGFVGLSVGSAVTALGAHIFDPIELPAQWAQPAVIETSLIRLGRKELRARPDVRPIALPNPSPFVAGRALLQAHR